MPGYDSDEPSKSEQSLKIFTDWLEGISSGQLKGNRAAKEQSQSSVKIKPPAFEGKGDPTHFFIKIKNFFEINKVQTKKEKSAILKSCLNEEALDLFITLSKDEQTDIEALERTFKNHFKPTRHDLIETERFLKIRKQKEQSVSNFYTKIKRKGLELKVDPALIKQAFCQGLSRDIQKHCALKNAGLIEEYRQIAVEFEKIA